jgi:hypothetical protein
VENSVPKISTAATRQNNIKKKISGKVQVLKIWRHILSRESLEVFHGGKKRFTVFDPKFFIFYNSTQFAN